jgi:hypothetical protein
VTKEEILQQIRRIASENAGSAPGTQTFYRETGCKRDDWYGKYWVRWSDALKEAGLTPNQMQEAYEEEFLIEKLIGLAKELGHFPIDGEIKMKVGQDKAFPWPQTFVERLGGKNQRLAKVIDYCQRKGGYEQVIRMCELAMPGKVVGTASESETVPTSVDRIGIVYLIKAGRYYKIGKTQSIGRREYDLAIQLAEKPTTIHVIKTDDPDGVENYWHRRFAAKRKNGEWFDLSSADVKAFKKWLRIA